MASISGQPSPKPQSVQQPDPQAEAQAFLADFEAPQMPDAQAEASAFMSEPAPTPAPPTEDQFAPEPGFAQANIEQFNPQNIVDRVRYGLAANDESAAAAMRTKYGPENVAIKNGKIYFRRDPKAKLKPLDPDTLEVFADLIPDAARMVVQEAAMLPGEAAGAAAGFSAGLAGTAGVGAFPLAAAGGTAGRVASVPLATEAADFVAEAAGVPDVTNRDKLTENLLGMAGEAFLPIIGRKVVGAVAKRIPGTQSYRVAREAGEREAVALSRQSREVVEAANRLNAEGIEAPILLHQMQPDDPKVKKLVDSVADAPQLIQREQEIAEGYGQSLRNTLKSIAERGASGERVAPEKLNQSITDAVQTLDRAEGQAIGRYKAKAMAALGGKKIPLPQGANDEVVSLMRELGFTPRKETLRSVTRRDFINPVLEQTQQMGRRNVVERQRWNPPKNIDEIAGKLGLDSSQARMVVNALKTYEEKALARGGEVRLQDLEVLINRMGDLSPKIRGTAASARMGKLTGDLRQFRREAIGSALGDEYEKKAFNDAMDEFSLIRQNVGDLQGVLGDNRSTKSIVNYFFQGPENINRIDALRAIVGKDSPQWGQLKDEFLTQLITKHSNPDSKTGINSKALLRDLEVGYGKDFARKIMDEGAGPNFQTVKDLLTYGQRIEATERGIKNLETAPEAVKRGLVNAAIGAFMATKGRVVSGLQAMLGAGTGREKALFEILNRDGIDKYVRDYPGKIPKSQVAGFLESSLQKYNTERRKEIIGRTVRGLGRYELSRDRAEAQPAETQP